MKLFQGKVVSYSRVKTTLKHKRLTDMLKIKFKVEAITEKKIPQEMFFDVLQGRSTLV